MVAPILTVEQYQFDDTGVLLNGNPPVPFIDVMSVEGLDSVPRRVNAHDREGLHGGYTDAEFESQRLVVIEAKLYAPVTAMETVLDSLKANYAPHKTPKPFYFQTDHATAPARLVFGKSLGLKYPKDAQRRLGIADLQMQIQCEDPRIYSVAPVTSQFTRTTGSGNITLSGNRESPAILTITTPSGVTITNPSINFAGNTILLTTVIPASSTLVIDLEKRTVILTTGSTVTNLRNTLSFSAGGWALLQPGVTTNFTFGGTPSSNTTTLNITARSAWW
jgi:hypothetical protein